MLHVWIVIGGLWALALSPSVTQAAEGDATTPDAASHQALLDADRAYHAAAMGRDRSAFHGLLASDAMFLGGSWDRGRIDYVAGWTPLFEGKYDLRYRGSNLEAHMAESGEMAWTLGDAETSFTRPGSKESVVNASRYLMVWAKTSEGEWRVKASATLVVHPHLGQGTDPRSGLMTAWPELAERFDAPVSLSWTPEATVRAESGEMAYSFGEYRVEFGDGEGARVGTGAFLSLWHKDAEGRWQLAGEGFTPPALGGADDAQAQ